MPDSHSQQIAIVGIGCRFPRGLSNHQELWHLLQSGCHTVREVPNTRPELLENFDPNPGTPGHHYLRHGSFFTQLDHFDLEPFGIFPEAAERIDPQQRLLLEVSQAALHDAGLDSLDDFRERAGVFVGLMAGDQEEHLHQDPDSLCLSDIRGASRFSTASRVASCLNLGGPSMVVDTACSSSLLSVHLACQSLRLGECSLALAGGVNVLLSSAVSISLAQGGLLSEDGLCRFGDAEGQGFGRGEGAGMVVLRPLEDALAAKQTIYAVIRGGAVTSRMGAGERGEEHERAARQALKAAGVYPNEINYLEVGSVGSLTGDYLELLGLGRVLGENRQATNPCWTGSVKTNLAHTEGAAGVAGLIKVALAIHQGQIPPSLHLRKPNPLVPWDAVPWRIVEQTMDWPGDGTRKASVHSFGLSGTAVHLVLEAAGGSPTPTREAFVPEPSPEPERPLNLPSHDQRPRTTTEVERQVLELLNDILGHPVEPDAHLLELGATSIDLIRFLAQLEQALGWRAELADLLRNATPAGFAQYLAERMSAEGGRGATAHQPILDSNEGEMEGEI